MYTKVFRSIFDGSLYGHFESTVTFLGFLILANKDGEVDQTAEKIAANTGFPLDLIQKGIADLTAPDKRSRTPDEDGKRLVLLDAHRDWGWRIVNFEKYNSIRNQQERAEYFRQYRKRKRNVLRVTDATKGNQEQPPKTPSYSDTDTDTDREGSTNPVELVFRHWREVHRHPKAQLDPKRRRLIAVALKTYSEADICQAISGYLNSPHHMGDNDRGTVYTDLETLIRDAKHIDSGLKFYAEPPRTDLSKLTRRNVAAVAGWEPPEVRNATE